MVIMFRSLILVFCVVASSQIFATAQTPTPTPAAPTQAGYTRPGTSARRARYLKNMFGPEAIVKNIAMGGLTTWSNSPREWGPNWRGFGKRVASNFGKEIISNTVKFGLEEAFELDSHYYRSRQHDLGPRLKNALVSTVTTRNREGDRVFGFPRIVGIYSSHIIAAEVWYPNRYGIKDGLRSGTFSLGMTAVYNIFKEFIHK